MGVMSTNRQYPIQSNCNCTELRLQSLPKQRGNKRIKEQTKDNMKNFKPSLTKNTQSVPKKHNSVTTAFLRLYKLRMQKEKYFVAALLRHRVSFSVLNVHIGSLSTNNIFSQIMGSPSSPWCGLVAGNQCHWSSSWIQSADPMEALVIEKESIFWSPINSIMFFEVQIDGTA